MFLNRYELISAGKALAEFVLQVYFCQANFLQRLEYLFLGANVCSDGNFRTRLRSDTGTGSCHAVDQHYILEEWRTEGKQDHISLMLR